MSSSKTIAPVPFFIVFNAAESYSAYNLVVECDLNFVNIISFSGAEFPCTIAVPFESWSPLAHKIYTESGTGYILRRVSESFLDTSGTPLAKMLASTQSTLDNPFDPAFVDRIAGNRGAAPVSVSEKDGPEVLTFDGSNFYRMGPALFKFSTLQWPESTEAIHKDPAIVRFVELVCLNAIAQIFKESGFRLKGAPDFIRISSGVIKASNYQDFDDFSSRIKSNVINLVSSYICNHDKYVSYDHILRIARGIAIADEIANIPFALKRWEQLLAPSKLKLSEKIRQFEMEMTSFHMRAKPTSA